MKILVKFAAIVLSMSSAADAALIYNVKQDGADVLVTLSGSLDTSGFSTPIGGSLLNQAGISPRFANVSVGAAGSVAAIYGGGSGGAASFGTGNRTGANSSGGNYVALDGDSTQSYLTISSFYVSGTSLSGFARFDNTTLSGLGLLSGIYTYTFGRDQVVVNIGGGVPEPATWGMMLLGLGTVGVAVRRRHRSVAAVAA